MKIVLVTESLGSGGAERQLVGLSIMLKRQGYDVFVLTYYPKDFYKSILDSNNVPNEVCVKALNKYIRFYRLSKRINELRADITISFLPSSNVSLGLAKSLGLLKSKLVVSERTYTWVWKKRTKFYFSLYSKADAIIANSKAEADNIKKAFPSFAHKTDYIQNFVDFEKFIPIVYKREDKIFRIITVARIIEYKNVKGLILAASILKKEGYPIIFDWYGNDYNDEYSQEVRNTIKEEGVSDIFTLKEPVKNIQDFYPQYDALCLPSYKEGYPNVVVEAMSCQLPILCSDICENPVIVEQNVNGFLFDPHIVDDIVQSIKKLYGLSKEQRAAIGVQNRKKVIENNSISTFTDKYLTLIKSL